MCMMNMNGRLVCVVEVHEFFKETPLYSTQAHPAESKAPILSMSISLMSFGSLFWIVLVHLPGCAGLLCIFNSNALGYSGLPWGTILSHYGSNSSASPRNMLLLRPNLWHRAGPSHRISGRLQPTVIRSFFQGWTRKDRLVSSAPSGDPSCFFMGFFRRFSAPSWSRLAQCELHGFHLWSSLGVPDLCPANAPWEALTTGSGRRGRGAETQLHHGSQFHLPGLFKCEKKSEMDSEGLDFFRCTAKTGKLNQDGVDVMRDCCALLEGHQRKPKAV